MKPRQAEPTGVDGGQIALAIGLGEKSWMSPSPRCKRLHLEVAGCQSLNFERELLNRRCESFRNATEDYAYAHEESSLGTGFHDKDSQSHIGNRCKAPASGFLPHQWSLSGDRRQTRRHAGASPRRCWAQRQKGRSIRPDTAAHIPISYFESPQKH